MTKAFKDCYVSYENNIITIGNSMIERIFEIKENILFSVLIKDKVRNVVWEGEEKEIIISSSFDYSKAIPVITTHIKEEDYLTDGYASVTIKWEYDDKGIIIKMMVSDNTPFISNEYKIKGDFEKEAERENYFDLGKAWLDRFPIGHSELEITHVRLNTVTDFDCNLAVENTSMLVCTKEFSGNVFIINDHVKDSALMIVKDGPSLTDSIEPSISTIQAVRNTVISVTAPKISDIERDESEYINLYGHTVGIGHRDTITKGYKNNYLKFSKGSLKTYIMSNTWGGENKDATINEALIEKEVEVGLKLGVDYVQLDDGWQTGVTKNSALKKSTLWGTGYYDHDINFWMLNKEKFPEGLDKLFKDKDIKPAFWFSPDLANDYLNYKKDIETIYGLYEKYGVTRYKMDGIKLLNKTMENRLIEVIKALVEKSGGKITFNFDITNGKRLGYHYLKEHGNLFLENRYIRREKHTYYPHIVLRTLWLLSDYVPTQRLQIEVIDNKKVSSEVFKTTFSPATFDISYIFAIAMIGNPLMWMEMSKLEEETISELSEIIKVYKKEREEIASSIISRVGNIPNGVSFTGFDMKNKNGGYLLLFREITKEASYTFDIPYMECEVLFSNSECKITNDSGRLRVNFGKERSFVFLKY